MNLSKNTVGVLVDLIENKLAMIQIGDREELREVMTLQRCLSELRGLAPEMKDPDSIPHRGRRRKLADMMEEMAVDSNDRRRA